MLVHIGLVEEASHIHNAWLKTLEDGIHTYDIFQERTSRQKVGTKEFAQAVVARLGQHPEQLTDAHYQKTKHVHWTVNHFSKSFSDAKKELVGADLLIQWDTTTEKLASLLTKLTHPKIKLTFIANRGAKVWPNQIPETLCSDCWRCRFTRTNKQEPLSYQDIINLLQAIFQNELEIVQVHSLYLIDGQPGFTQEE